MIKLKFRYGVFKTSKTPLMRLIWGNFPCVYVNATSLVHTDKAVGQIREHIYTDVDITA